MYHFLNEIRLDDSRGGGVNQNRFPVGRFRFWSIDVVFLVRVSSNKYYLISFKKWYVQMYQKQPKLPFDSLFHSENTHVYRGKGENFAVFAVSWG